MPGAELIVGWFDQTLPGFLDDHPGPVTLLHLDADLYCSTKTVLDLVGPRLVPGSIVIFDEYFNYPGWQQHEHRAWQEYVTRTGTEFVVEAYTVDNEQVAIRITETGHTQTLAHVRPGDYSSIIVYELDTLRAAARAGGMAAVVAWFDVRGLTLELTSVGAALCREEVGGALARAGNPRPSTLDHRDRVV